MKRAKKPVIATNVWWCETCADRVEMSQPEAVAHLRDVHKFRTEGLKCSKRMVLHLDCADSFSSNHEVTVVQDGVEVKLTQATTTPRGKDDWMWRGGE